VERNNVFPGTGDIITLIVKCVGSR
jgi:hypothetical protein